jgi:hypothetical protein
VEGSSGRYRHRWDSGEQTSLIPGPGVLNVVAKGRGRKLASKKATATKKTQPSKTPTLSPPSKTGGAGALPSVTRQTRAAKKATTKASEAVQRGVPTKTLMHDSPRPGAGRRAQ